MLTYASGLALPIFIMGQFPAMIKKLPKSGSWMNAIKVVFGFIADEGNTAPYLILRGVRYGILGLWVTLGAPAFFVRLKLAPRSV